MAKRCGYREENGKIEIIECIGSNNPVEASKVYIPFTKRQDMLMKVARDTSIVGGYKFAGKYDPETKIIHVFGYTSGKKPEGCGEEYDKVEDAFFECSMERNRKMQKEFELQR